MSSNDSIKKTLIVAFSLCIVCSVIVSTAADRQFREPGMEQRNTESFRAIVDAL